MPKFLFTNNARGTLKVAMLIGDTQLTLNAGQGALFPAPNVGNGEAFRVTLVDNSGNIEIIECTTRVADVFTVITRGKEGTAPLAMPIGGRVSLRVTEQILESLRDGGNLGTMALQNANNVGITGGAICGSGLDTFNMGPPLPRRHLSGFGMSNDGVAPNTTLDIAAGICRDIGDLNNIKLAVPFTKILDNVWAVGSGLGMNASGAGVANGTYHIFAIKRPDTGVVDIAADTSVIGANIAANTNANYTSIRRIGSILREAGAIFSFSQLGDYFRRKASVLDVNQANPGAGAVLAPLSVPNGLIVEALMQTYLQDNDTGNPTSPTALYISDPAANDEAPVIGGAAPLATQVSRYLHGTDIWDVPASNRVREFTNTARQIRYRVSVSGAGTTVAIATLGWFDTRDKFL